MRNVATVVRRRLNGFVVPGPPVFKIGYLFSFANICLFSVCTGLPQTRNFHLPQLRRHPSRPRRAHLVRPLHHHGRFQDR